VVQQRGAGEVAERRPGLGAQVKQQRSSAISARKRAISPA